VKIRFLGLDEIIALHAAQIERYGGSPGVRDLGLLESAAAAPEASFGGEYLHATLAEIAAAYLFHLAQNHPFVDGNTRIAAASMLMVIYLNDADLDCDEDALVDLTVGVASGRITKAAAAVFLAERIVGGSGPGAVSPRRRTRRAKR
jgi:death-on-curing protein